MPPDMTQESGTDPTVPDLFHAGSAWTTLTRQRIGHTQGDQPGAALSKVDTRMACFVHLVHRGDGAEMAFDIDSVGKPMPPLLFLCLATMSRRVPPLWSVRDNTPPNLSPDLCNKASRGRLPTCRHQQHGNREGPFFPFAST